MTVGLDTPPLFRHSAETRFTTIYLPAMIVDDAFVIVARTSSAAAYELLDRRTRESVWFSAAILALTIAVGIAGLRLLLAPLRALRRRAEQIAVETTGQPVGDRTGDAVASVVKVLDTLTSRLVARNAELVDAKAAAEAASRAKSGFLSNMSHEIRTPLFGVLGMVDLLAWTPLDDTQRKYCQAIRTAGRTLHGLLGDILDVAKIEAGRMQLERGEFTPAELFGEVGKAYAELAAARGTRLTVDLDPAIPARVVGDATRLRQVLSNLLSNAVKFCEGGTISVRVRACRPSGGGSPTGLQCEVHDTGIGMTPETMRTIFDPFTQADASSSRRYGGSGLGLSICKALVEMMGGAIDVSSAPGEGSTFRFEIPVEPACPAVPGVGEAAVAEAAVAERPTDLGLKVLVAEDSPVNQEVLRAMLARIGAVATTVDDGAAAVAAMRRERFAIVLMDCQMPGMDGFEATARIRAMEQDGRRTPIVALTANAVSGDRQRCLDAGMDDYLTKPIPLEALGAALARWGRRSEPDLSAGGMAAAAPASLEPSVAAAPAAARQGGPESDVSAAIDKLIEETDASVAARIVRIYVETAGEQRRALAQSERQKDLSALGRTLHSLKSSSAMLGGTELARLAAEGERLARSGDSAAFALIGPVDAALVALVAVVSALPCLDEAAPGEQGTWAGGAEGRN